MVLCPPANSNPRISEASRINDSAVRASVGYWVKNLGEQGMRAEINEKARMPFIISISFFSGMRYRASKSDVL